MMDTQQLHTWYTEHAKQFEDVVAVEESFLHQPLERQQRLSRFKLWILEAGALVSLKGKRILEFGCGHGRLAVELTGYESYTGIDRCEELVEIGRRRVADAGLTLRAQLLNGDCMEFQGAAGQFDVVCSLGMFSFVEDPETVLKKMAFHLKPGGTLFMDGHYASPLYQGVRQRLWARRTADGSSTQKRAFAARDIRALFSAAGLVNVRVVMREYPFLGPLYARTGWRGVLGLRNQLARRRIFNVFGTDFFAVATKPNSPGEQQR